MSDIEILSPAGSLETLKCAINNGADAVYIGGRSFSARKNAVNFTNEEITEAIHYAHLYGAKVYVTVNTLVYDSEFESLFDFVSFLYRERADALIIQDLGVLYMMRKYFPDFEIHASTQMTIHNIEGARLAKELGFKRVVLSRELSFREIKMISETVDIELEVFVHGALCMSYSGQCLMSSFIGGRSGNRGACAQPCRLPYTLLSGDGRVISDENKYLLSLKDLCLIDEMERLIECGVKSLKIEGRMKSAEYVSLVTSIYDKYRTGGKVSSEDYSALQNIFSRSGFTKGYLEDYTGRHMLNYARNNDSVYDDITDSVRLLAESLKKKGPTPIEFDAEAKIAMGKPMELTVFAKGKTVSVVGTVEAERAINVPLDEERVIGQIAKSGSTPFKLAQCKLELDPNVSLPIKEINNIRRDALTLLFNELLSSEKIDISKEFLLKKVKAGTSTPKLYAEVRDVNQLRKAKELGFDKVLIPYSLYAENKNEIESMECEFAIILPPIVRDKKKMAFDIDGKEVYASNFSQLSLCDRAVVNANFTINAFNSLSVEFLGELGVNSVCISPEVSLREISTLTSSVKKEVIAYGRIPLMTVQNCIVKSSQNKCGCNEGSYLLKDRKGMEFPLYTDKDTCTNIIYNALPLYMGDKLDEFESDGIYALRFIFTTDSPYEMEKIYMSYKSNAKPDFDFTRGHYYKSV